MKKIYMMPASDVIRMGAEGEVMNNLLGNSNRATTGGGDADDPTLQGARENSDFLDGTENPFDYEGWE